MFALAIAEAGGIPVVVVAGAVATFIVALMTSAFVQNPYDLIGRGVFDRPRGDRGERPPSDAEYEEWATAMADYCSHHASAPVPGDDGGRS
jgi:hypothetical protein